MNLDFYEFQSKERIRARLQEAERYGLLAPIRERNAQRTRALLNRLKVWWRSVFEPSASRSGSNFKSTTPKAQSISQAEESQ
jgi:hypothetical protein